MALPAPGNPISANMINVEANRTGSTYAPLSVNQIPVSTSLIGLYVDSGVNQVAPHKYSEFYSKTFVQPQSPYWFINTTNFDRFNTGIGKKYYLSGNYVIQNPSAPLYDDWQTFVNQDGGSGLAINNNEKLVIGGSVANVDLSPDERYPLLMSFNPTTGIPDTATAYDWTGTLQHWVSNMHFINGFDDKVFWLDQERGTNDGGNAERRRYGVVNIDATQNGSNFYPELWQYTGWVRRIQDTAYEQGRYYSSPKAASINFSQSVSPYDDTTKSYIYVCNQLKNVSSANGYNGAVTRMTYDNTTSTGTSVCLSSPVIKLYEQNPGNNASPWYTADMTTFADICVIPYNGGGPY